MSNDQRNWKNPPTVIIDAGDTDERSEDEDIAQFLNENTGPRRSITNSLLTHVSKRNEAFKLGEEEDKDDDVIEVIRVNPSNTTEEKGKSLARLSSKRDLSMRCADNVLQKKKKLCDEAAHETSLLDVTIEDGEGHESESERLCDLLRLQIRAYFEYLQKCVTNISFEQDIQESTRLYEHFHEAIKCIETEIDLHSQMFDQYIRKHQWSKQVKACIQSSSLREIKEISHNLNGSYCDNCSSQRRIAKYTLVFSGYSLDASRLYEFGWTKRIVEAFEIENYQHKEILVDDICHVPVALYWTLLHVKRLWCAMLDAKEHESGLLRFADTFLECEYKRYRELLEAVRCVTSERDLHDANLAILCDMFLQKECASPFLLREEVNSGLDSSMEENGSGVQDSETSDEDGEEGTLRLDKESMKRSQGPKESSDVIDDASASNHADKISPETECEKICLICSDHPIDGAVIHGNYLHSYSCYRCGMLQFDQRLGCSVCNRPIDKVVRLLPLTKASRSIITTRTKSI
uniref:Uncharacterized protein AlNc14C4G601 n=1 Tax=Albugo laibachii Nc14 TaxID=890382 RepID=F0W0F8_9STRA|nr:conserved hypothetical protein [Albugo laibachii Nc14]|eukprot:CCA14530.1 conserved hypothetical protein [Albugo laibachii Nc14]